MEYKLDGYKSRNNINYNANANNQDCDLDEMMRKKNELLRRIEENKRLMELIRNPHIKDSLGPLQMMKKNIAIKKIQKFWRKRKQMREEKEKMTNQKLRNKSIIEGLKNPNQHLSNYVDVHFQVMLIQKAVRRFLSRKSKDRLAQLYINDTNREFFSQMKMERVNQLKQEIVNNIKSSEMPNKNTDFQEILNIYYSNYQKFNDEFPDHIRIRNDNLSKYYQCISMLNHMNTQTNLNSMYKFNSFYIDQSKRSQIRTKLDKILNSIENKMWWYKYRDMDDFEDNNIINEIDSHFNFERIEDIMAKKPNKNS